MFSLTLWCVLAVGDRGLNRTELAACLVPKGASDAFVTSLLGNWTSSFGSGPASGGSLTCDYPSEGVIVTYLCRPRDPIFLRVFGVSFERPALEIISGVLEQSGMTRLFSVFWSFVRPHPKETFECIEGGIEGGTE